jgi:hypothetical protein
MAEAATDEHVEIRWAVLDRAMQWWMDRRPVSLTHEQHLEHPRINCVSQIEQELADAVAAYMKLPA